MSSPRDILINILTKGDPSGSQKVSGSLDQLGETADRVGKKLSLAVTAPLVGLGAVSVKFAADAAESADKLEAVFGPATDTVNQKIEALRETIPATTAELQDLFSGIQDLLVPLGMAPAEAQEMSGSIVQLAGDLASFNNIPIGEALERIRSGLVGQYEPLLKFGVALNATQVKAEAFARGIGDGKRELTAAERAQISYQLILEGTTAAHGNAADTAESAANQFKFLKSESTELMTVIGEQLLPAITPLVSGLKDAAAAAQDLNPAVLDIGIGLAGLAASAGPVLIATGAVLKYRNALRAATVVSGPWLAVLGSAAIAYNAISATAADAKSANDAFKDSIGLGDTSFVDSILGAEDQAQLDMSIAEAKVKLDALVGTIRDQKAQINEEASFFESGIADAIVKNGLREELELMEAQAQALRDAIALGQERGSELIETNSTIETQAEGMEQLTELQEFLNTLTEEEKALRENALADIDTEIALLDAKLADEDALVAKLEDQKREQAIINQLKRQGVTLAEAEAKAEELVAKQRKLREQKSKPAAPNGGNDGNDDLRTRLGLLDQVGAKEQQQRQLKDGYRSDEIIGLDGKTQTRYFDQRGSIVDESQAFTSPAAGGQGSTPAAAQQPTTPNQQPQPQAAPDTAPVEQALAGVTLDLSPLVAAVEQMGQRLQTQIDNNASRIEQLGN